MEKKPQNLQNHGKVDPLFHFFLAPVALLMLVGAAYHLFKDPTWMSAAHLLIAIWALVALFKIRLYALKVQDRVISSKNACGWSACSPRLARLASTN